SAIEPLGTERIFVDRADGRYIAEPIVAPDDVPRFDNSSRDGYAVRWADIDTGDADLEVVGESAAGHTASRELGPGEAIRIATGGKVPDGADTVVMQENCQRSGDTVTIPEPPADGRGAWIRHAGSYLERGEAVTDPGARLGPAEIGLLASFRDSRIEVFRRPRVAVVSTGDELVDIDSEPGEGQIVNSNAYLLESLLEEAGADPIVLPTAPDDADAIRSAFRSAIASADAVISSGGVSVGDYDEVGGIVDELTGG
ncbi:MAG: molybdopterin molybdotransferase MoeA, partial [Bradymonadaceae bacterium]